MEEDELFHQEMTFNGIAPLDKRRTKITSEPIPAQEEAPDPHGDETLFFKALEQLEETPDKDRPAGRPEREAAPQKLKAAKLKQIVPQSSLDLHGKTLEEALPELARFVENAVVKKYRALIIITGKGLRSPGGLSVLKPAVEDWIVRHGRGLVSGYGEAPRRDGGRGALILLLK